MSKYIILYRIKDEYDGCRYIELNSDGTIHVDCGGKPIVSNARCVVRIDEDFDDVETWLTEDVFNRMKNTDGSDTFSDVADMIANGEHREFEAYVRESEIEKMCDEYGFDEDDAKDIIAPLFYLNDLRVCFAHLISQETIDEYESNIVSAFNLSAFTDYRKLYDTLIDKLYYLYRYLNITEI